MKNKLITLLVALTLFSASARAQLGTVGNHALAGAALGGVAGAVIGNNSRGHDSAKGALIGVAAGGLIGAVVGQQKVINRTQPISAPIGSVQPYRQDSNPYAWEPANSVGASQWVQSPPDQPYNGGGGTGPHFRPQMERRHSGPPVIVVQSVPASDIESRIAHARAEAESARRNAEALRQAFEQALSSANAAERRFDDLARSGRGYAAGGCYR